VVILKKVHATTAYKLSPTKIVFRTPENLVLDPQGFGNPRLETTALKTRDVLQFRIKKSIAACFRHCESVTLLDNWCQIGFKFRWRQLFGNNVISSCLVGRSLFFDLLILVYSFFAFSALLQPLNFSTLSFTCKFQGWGCVVSREIIFLLENLLNDSTPSCLWKSFT